MGSFAQEHWPRLRQLEPSPFSGDCTLLESELWHDRPTAEVYRFVVDHGERQAAYYFKRHKTAPERAAMEYQTLARLSDLFSDRDDLGVVEPVALSERDAALVTAEFRGDEVREIVKRGARIGAPAAARAAAADAVRSVARFLRQMQSLDAADEPAFDLESLLSWVNDDLAQCLASGMLEGPSTAQVRTELSRARRRHAGRSSPVVAVNSDTKLWNFLVDADGRLRALDFVGMQTGFATHDFARVWIGLDWLRAFPQTSGAAIDELQRVLVGEMADYELWDAVDFRFHCLCVAVRAATFVTSVPGDPYRRKLRNVVGFPLIRRYYRDLVRRCLRSAITGTGDVVVPDRDVIRARLAERSAGYFPELGGPLELESRPFSEESTYPLHRFALRGPGGEREIVAKVAPTFEDNNEARTEYENLSALAPVLAAAGAPVSAPRALDYIEDLGVVVTELVPHERFSDWLLAANSRFASAETVARLRELSRLAGQLLALIHRETRSETVAIGDSNLARSFWSFLEVAYEHGLPRACCDRVARFLSDLPAVLAATPVDRALVHGDYGPQNLGITAGGGDGLVVFDLQRTAHRVVYNDIAYYLVTLETLNPLPRHPLFARRRALSLRGDFLRGYFGGDLSDAQQRALHLYYLKHLIQRLHKQSGNIARSGSRLRREAFNRVWLQRTYPRAIDRELEALRRLVEP